MYSIKIATISLSLLITLSQQLHFYLTQGELKCFLEDSPSETHIVGYYEIKDKLEQNDGVLVAVYHSQNNTLIYRTTLQKRKGKFSFVPHVNGQLKFCYQTINGGSWIYEKQKIRFGIRHSIGQSKINTEGLVKNQDLRSIQSSARMLLDSVKEFVQTQVIEAEDEDHLFNHLQVVSIRISRITQLQIVVVLLAGVYQIYSLRKFFIKKQIA